MKVTEPNAVVFKISLWAPSFYSIFDITHPSLLVKVSASLKDKEGEDFSQNAKQYKDKVDD
jgi:hypothetical protein